MDTTYLQLITKHIIVSETKGRETVKILEALRDCKPGKCVSFVSFLKVIPELNTAVPENTPTTIRDDLQLIRQLQG